MTITTTNDLIADYNQIKFKIFPQKWVVTNSRIIITFPSTLKLPSITDTYCNEYENFDSPGPKCSTSEQKLTIHTFN